MTATLGTYYSTRWTPLAGGPYPLRLVNARHLELYRGPTPEVFTSAKRLLTALHGTQYLARHWTLDRYLGRPVEETSIAIVGPLTPAQFEWSRRIIVGPSLPKLRGLDLVSRSHEVAKLLHAGFGSWIRSSGYEFEDVLQEVYRKILVSNAGTRPWDPAKSSFGHYVHLICRSALSNFHRKASRIASKEQVGIVTLGRDESRSVVDAREAVLAKSTVREAVLDPAEDLKVYIAKSPLGRRPEAPLALRLLPLVQAGYSLKDSAESLGVERSAIARAMALLRLSARRWSC